MKHGAQSQFDDVRSGLEPSGCHPRGFCRSARFCERGLGLKSPNFGPRVYADGVAWGTKGTTTLPAPSVYNEQSFDKLFAIAKGVAGSSR